MTLNTCPILDIFESPLSWLSAVAFLILAILLYNNNAYRRYSYPVSLVSMLLLTLLIAIEGTWQLSTPLHYTIPFIILSFLFLFPLATTSISDFTNIFSKFSRTTSPTSPTSQASLSRLLCHTGAIIALSAMFFGAPDLQKGQAIIYRNASTRIAYTEDARPMALPFELQLNDFRIDYYEDQHSPKQYTTTFTVTSIVHPTEKATLTTSVNHPAHYDGYSFYQDSFDRAGLRFSVIKVVRDPWYPIVLIGFVILAIGAVLSIASKWRPSRLLPIAAILTVIFIFVTVRKINLGNLMPALRSYWFIPHLIIYMVAYALMALSILLLIYSSISKISRKTRLSSLTRKTKPTANCQLSTVNCQLEKALFSSSSALLILGMLCGAIWAKQAWGDYWTWDAKENWAAVTWLFSIAATHSSLFYRESIIYRKSSPSRKSIPSILYIFFILISFIALQITWYGVNYLPSANRSLHAYTKSH